MHINPYTFAYVDAHIQSCVYTIEAARKCCFCNSDTYIPKPQVSETTGCPAIGEDADSMGKASLPYCCGP